MSGTSQMELQASDQLFSAADWGRVREVLALSARQEQITLCLCAGLSDKEIAGRLNITVATVRTHLERVFAKLGVRDRTQLVLTVFRCFLASCPSPNARSA